MLFETASYVGLEFAGQIVSQGVQVELKLALALLFRSKRVLQDVKDAGLIVLVEFCDALLDELLLFLADPSGWF